MTYEQAVDYLGSLNLYGWRMGNARMRQFLRLLGDPQERLKVIHIAGTNGKGSTTAFIASILDAAGYRTGSYFSPYVFDLRERIQLNGQLIPQDDLARWVAACQPVIERLRDTEYGQVTEFELKTALAYAYFAEQKVDFAVMETGLGGRLDATNVMVPEVSVITSIGLDHTDRLGPSPHDIAYEKGAILKSGRPAVCAVSPPSARELLTQLANRRSVPITWIQPKEARVENSSIERELRYSSIDSPTDSSLRVGWQGGSLELHPKLIGGYQRSNAACALGTALCLRERGWQISDSAIQRGVASAHLPGRLQVVRENPLVVLDGAHNAEAIRALTLTLPKLFTYKRLILVFGMFKPHDPRETLETLLPLASEAILTRTDYKRAYFPEELLAYAPESEWSKITLQSDPPQAFQDALNRAQPSDLILITGSFYLIGMWNGMSQTEF